MGNSLTGGGALAAYEIIVPSVEYKDPIYTQFPCQLSVAIHNVKKVLASWPFLELLRILNDTF